MTIRQMSRLYSGNFNFYKTTYSGGQITRETANKKISTNWNAQKNNLNAEFSDAMANLKKSADEVKNLDFGEEKSVESVKNLFPSVQNNLYGGRGILQNMSQNNIGGLLNLFF